LTELFPFNTCVYAVTTATFVTKPTNTEALWECTYKERYRGVELSAFAGGVLVADCREWLDSFPELLEPDRREERALFRHHFRAAHILALARAIADDDETQIQLPDIGTPIAEVHAGSSGDVRQPHLEMAYRRARGADGSFPIATVGIPSFFPAVRSDTISKSLKVACDTINRGQDERHILSLLYDSVRSYTQGLAYQSFITCWAVVEKCLTAMFDEFVSSKYAGQRAKKLRDSRAFSIAVVIELLEREGILTPDEYEGIESARRSRNKFMHRLAPIDGTSASELLRLARPLVGRATGFEPLFGLMRGIPG
jgi:hypothetical protein